MSNVRTIFANMSWMVIAQGLTSILAFVWTLLTARYLGVNDYGILGTAMAFPGIFWVILDFGTMYYAVREISTDLSSEQKYLDNCVTLRFIFGAIYFVVVWFALMVIGWDDKVVLICMLFAIYCFINGFKNLLFISFQAHEQMKYQSFTHIISSVLTFIFILLVIFTDQGLLGITLAYIIGTFIGLLYNVYALTKHFVVPKFSFDLPLYKILIIGGIPFALNGFFYFIYYSIDIVMLAQFSNSYATGIYNASYKLVDALSLFYTIYTATIFPVMSKLFTEDNSLLKISLSKSIKYLSFVTIPLSVASIFYGQDIIVLCYGNKFAESGAVLAILVWSICFLFINGAAITTLNAAHKERFVTLMYFITSIFNVIVNLILIPQFNFYGAAVATVLSDILLIILAMYMLRKIDLLPEVNLVYDLLKIMVSSIFMGIVLYYADLNLWLAIPVAIIVYFASIYVVRFLDEDDKNIIKQVLGR
jgi:O-antigen/teichoic acid export membrane protein